MNYGFWTSKVLLAESRKRELFSCKRANFHENRRMTQPESGAETYEKLQHPQTLRCNQGASELRWTSDTFMFLISPIFKQACADQLSYTCDSIVFWVCGEQITRFFGSTDYMLRATVLKKLYLRVNSTGASSISTPDLDNEILDLEPMLSVMYEAFGGLGRGRCILLVGAM